MTRLESTLTRLSKLPEAERDELVDWIDLMLDGIEIDSATGLSDPQRADLKLRLASPEDLASDEEVAAFFARHRARP